MDEGSCAGFLRFELRCQSGVQCYSQRSSPWASSLLQAACEKVIVVASVFRGIESGPRFCTKGMIGCFMSHRRIWQKAGGLAASQWCLRECQMISENLPAVVVLEDLNRPPSLPRRARMTCA